MTATVTVVASRLDSLPRREEEVLYYTIVQVLGGRVHLQIFVSDFKLQLIQDSSDCTNSATGLITRKCNYTSFVNVTGAAGTVSGVFFRKFKL